jgi:hypothetical protein
MSGNLSFMRGIGGNKNGSEQVLVILREERLCLTVRME